MGTTYTVQITPRGRTYLAGVAKEAANKEAVRLIDSIICNLQAVRAVAESRHESVTENEVAEIRNVAEILGLSDEHLRDAWRSFEAVSESTEVTK